jgi:hypothetical protein
VVGDAWEAVIKTVPLNADLFIRRSVANDLEEHDLLAVN